MTAISQRRTLVNLFGTFGYISLICQWGWSLLLVAMPLVESGALDCFMPSHRVATTPPPVRDYGVFSPVLTIAAVAITVAVLVVTVIMISRLPATIGKQGARLTHGAAAKTTTHIQHAHKTLPKQARRQLSYRLVLAFKAAAIVIPLIAMLFATDDFLPRDVAWAVALFGAVTSLINFSIQQLLARVLLVNTDAIW